MDSGIQISAMTWRTVDEHIVADTFCSKKSSSMLLVHEQQVSDFRYFNTHLRHNLYTLILLKKATVLIK